MNIKTMLAIVAGKGSSFILQLLEGFEGIKEALSILLYSYQKKAESDSKSGSCECKAEEIVEFRDVAFFQHIILM